MAIDPEGNVVVTGQSGADYATVKYAADGAQLWIDVFNGPTEDAVPGATPTPCAKWEILSGGSTTLYGAPSLAVDSGGNAYVSGTMTRCSADYVTIKYDREGTRAWVVTYDGPEHVPARFAIDDVRQPVDDQATAIAVDPTGAVYVTGSSDKNFRTVKYDSDGHQLWVTAYDGPSDSTDEPRALGVAPDGSVYVTGFSCCGNGLFLVVLKYRPDGRLLWARRVDEDGDDVPKGMAIDGNGDVAVTADTTWSVFFSGDYADYLVAKFGSDGTWEWFARYDGPAGRTDSPGGVAFGPNGYVYVTGTSDGGDTDHDFATIEYRR
jgi:WD40 repeat protein